MDAPNLERSFNPCCGYITDAADEIPEFTHTIPDAGDLSICLNCGQILVYIDGARNKTRMAIRRDLKDLNSKQRKFLSRTQKYIFKRGRIRKYQ